MYSGWRAPHQRAMPRAAHSAASAARASPRARVEGPRLSTCVSCGRTSKMFVSVCTRCRSSGRALQNVPGQVGCKLLGRLTQVNSVASTPINAASPPSHSPAGAPRLYYPLTSTCRLGQCSDVRGGQGGGARRGRALAVARARAPPEEVPLGRVQPEPPQRRPARRANRRARRPARPLLPRHAVPG